MSYWILEYRYADLDARARVRPEHLAYMRGLHEQGTVVYAGPVDDGTRAAVLVRADSQEDVRAIVAADPYTAAGAAADHVIRPWSVVIGA